MVAIKGLEKFAPRDYPGFLSCTVFTGGCNFRCPYCHNADLVLRPGSLPTFPLEFFRDFLDARNGWLEAVCVSGGEPLIHENLEALLRMIKARGFQVKLDTNGSFPSRLRVLVERGLVDYIALDVKAPPAKYRAATGLEGDTEAVRETADVIIGSGLDHVFRTTAVPGLVDTNEDIEGIGEMLGNGSYLLQQYAPGNALDCRFREKPPHSREKLQSLARTAEKYFTTVTLEGI